MFITSYNVHDNISARSPIKGQVIKIKDKKIDMVNRYPVLPLIFIPSEIKRLLDSKSLNPMDLLDFSKIKDKFSLSDLIGLLAVQDIASKSISLNARQEHPFMTSYLCDVPDSDPAITSDIHGRVSGDTDRGKLNGSFVINLRSIWDSFINNIRDVQSTDTTIYYDSNIRRAFVNTPPDISAYYESYLKDDRLDECKNNKPWKLVIGNKVDLFRESPLLVQPIFMLLDPGACLYLSVRDNFLDFFSEYVKIHYSLMPIQAVSTLSLFKTYFSLL